MSWWVGILQNQFNFWLQQCLIFFFQSLGIHKHILGMAIGAYVGTKFGHWADNTYKRRDYVIYEYMNRHPEDFQKRKLHC